MSDLRPAEDVAAEIAKCIPSPWTDEDGTPQTGLCVRHGQLWPAERTCPELTRVTALIEADRKAAMTKAWDEGFTKAGRLLLGMDDDAWPPASNPYEAADNGGCDPPCT